MFLWGLKGILFVLVVAIRDSKRVWPKSLYSEPPVLTRMGIARLTISDLPEPERLAISRTVSSRVGESKALRHGERACPLGCASARSRSGPPTTYTHGDSGIHLPIWKSRTRGEFPAVLVCVDTP